MLDYHIHSNISADSEEEAEAYCAYALKAGIEEICFTEHLDIGFQYDGIVFLPDLGLYEKIIEGVRNKYKTLTIRKGMEVGLQPGVSEKTKTYLSGRNFDFIIASQHLIGGQDPWLGDFFKGKTTKNIFMLYLNELFINLKQYDFYNVVGHIGYPSKFCPLEDKVLRYADFSELLDEILKHIVKTGKGLEINTSSFAVSGEDMPERNILKRYRELHGEIITVGSDAHRKERLGDGYARVMAYLKDLGFRYICKFDNMKPSFIKI